MNSFLLIEQLFLGVLIILAISSFTFELYKRYAIIMKGTGTFQFDQIHIRLKKVLLEFLLQKKFYLRDFFQA